MVLHSQLNEVSQRQEQHSWDNGIALKDERPHILGQREIQGAIQNSAQVSEVGRMQNSINSSKSIVAQRKTNDKLFGSSCVKGMAANEPMQLMKEDEEPKQMKMEESEVEHEEEEPAQMKSEESEVEEEESVQMKSGSPQQATSQSSGSSGLPGGLKTGIESLSGMSMNEVKVHYNSSKPAGLNALAYAQGNDIHLGSGQEKHLAHEAWHVVQQKQGRVKANTQLKGTSINDDVSLEKEADMMGQKAMSQKSGESIQKKKRE